MSKCTELTKLGERAFGDNPVLEEIIFSDSIETMHSAAMKNCAALKRLDLPEAFKELKVYSKNQFETLTGVTEIVWPVSLTDGSNLAVLPNVKTIYYRGSELQWSLTAGRELFPNAEIVFDYAD